MKRLPFQQGQGQFNIEFQGDTDLLAEKLLQLKGFKLEIVEVSSGKISVMIKG